MDNDVCVIKCLACYLRTADSQPAYQDLLPLVPLDRDVASAPALQRLAKRLGLMLVPIAHTDIDRMLERGPVLLMRRHGATRVLLSRQPNGYAVRQPALSDPVLLLPHATVLGEENAFAIASSVAARGPWVPIDSLRLILLDWVTDYMAHDDAAHEAIRQQAGAVFASEREPAPLEALSINALLRAHHSMSPDNPSIYGVLRTINPERRERFVDARAIRPLLARLFDVIHAQLAAGVDDVLLFAAQVLSDYLGIHPFYNGNRRTAIVLVSRLLWTLGYDIDWKRISTTQFYYMVRCAARGRLRPMRDFLAHASRPRQEQAQREGTRLPARLEAARRRDSGIIPAGVWQVLDGLKRRGFAAFIVGGAVRDILRGAVPSDFDIATSAGTVDIHATFDVAHIGGGLFQQVVVETESGPIQVATFRATATPARGLIPNTGSDVAGAVETDARLRDFTVNAMYFDAVDGILVDILDGRRDLDAHCLRAVLSPTQSFQARPLERIRAIRLGAQIDLRLDETVVQALYGCTGDFGGVDPQRLAKELGVILTSGNARIALRTMFDTGILRHILPQVYEDMARAATRRFIDLGLEYGDRDRQSGGDLPCAYFLAVLSWKSIEARAHFLVQSLPPALAIPCASDDVLDAQGGVFAILLAKHQAALARIVSLQPYFDSPGASYRPELARNPCWRAGGLLAHARHR